jgi:hypothetical protein
MDHTDWTKEELVAYILLFAANSNFTEDEQEKNNIISKVDIDTYERIHKEFDQDNDYKSIQKIMTGLKQHNYSEDALDFLFSDIKELFLADGEFDILERNMFANLKRLLK